MREIKFRGLTKSSYPNFIYGDLINYESGECSVLENPFTSYGCEGTEIIKRTQVIPETIGQFTGFKDKNYVEIYEGDIVSMQHGLYKYTVHFENGSFVCYHLEHRDLVNGGKLKWGLLSRSFELGEDYELEVIGNVHQKLNT